MALIYILIAIIALVYMGIIRLPGNVHVNNRYNPNNARFKTPGRNARQQQLASQKSDAQTRQKETLILQNYEGERGAEGNGGMEREGEGEGGFVEHPELARGVRDVRALRVAAAEARMKRDKANAELARRRMAERKAAKGRSALEQASVENVGWRNVDAVREMRSYN
ncbi:hypothetical protein Vi05172_g9238 [Venturia inaequalis]|nr:hypothetical protein Vi05172_g9238 [Venturia inaequalis]